MMYPLNKKRDRELLNVREHRRFFGTPVLNARECGEWNKIEYISRCRTLGNYMARFKICLFETVTWDIQIRSSIHL